MSEISITPAGNDSGAMMCPVRWFAHLDTGDWVGAYDRQCIERLIALVREEALEEAAKMCKKIAADSITAIHPRDVSPFAWAVACLDDCENAIRSMMQELK